MSWEQPESNGLGGWEGFCGQTATANLLTTYEGRAVSPIDVSQASGDWTPGSRPSTLMEAIGQLSRSAGSYRIATRPDLSAAAPRRPIICLLNWEGTTFHYVTVVGSRGGVITFNHWGRQDRMAEAEFQERWSFSKGGLGASAISFFGGLPRHTSILR